MPEETPEIEEAKTPLLTITTSDLADKVVLTLVGVVTATVAQMVIKKTVKAIENRDNPERSVDPD